MKKALFCMLLAGIAAFAQKAPKTMTKMEVVLQISEVPKGSFPTKPKVMYRAGNQYCRIEEQPDPEHGIHGVIVINEPDVWMVNLADKTAKHGVDQGPTFNCRMPIFANRAMELPADQRKELMEFEFGLELGFFISKGVAPKPGPISQSKQTTAYMYKIGDSTLALFTFGSPERPLAVYWTRGGTRDILWYSGYGEVEFDAKLFAKPEGMKMEEMKM
jgi:hypothetical protein